MCVNIDTHKQWTDIIFNDWEFDDTRGWIHFSLIGLWYGAYTRLLNDINEQRVWWGGAGDTWSTRLGNMVGHHWRLCAHNNNNSDSTREDVEEVEEHKTLAHKGKDMDVCLSMDERDTQFRFMAAEWLLTNRYLDQSDGRVDGLPVSQTTIITQVQVSP